MPRLNDDVIQEALRGLPGCERSGDAITREFPFRDFVEAFGFMAQVGLLQEQMDHHATITNTWNTVTLTLSTHSEGGLTALDLELARRISDRVPGASSESPS